MVILTDRVLVLFIPSKKSWNSRL